MRDVIPPRVYRRAPSVWPGRALVGLGALTIALVIVRYNPWTGALWMVVTFMGALVALEPLKGAHRHRFGMVLLGGFSWWAALQGFGPAIGIALSGVDPSTRPYAGDQPGPFTPFFLVFLVIWMVPFLLAYWIAGGRAPHRQGRPASPPTVA